ncbi:MAG: hypothetical protein NZ651_02090 [Candidatus Bipolaricaulota bacterium]|nr:hypothetical protein [Candidatus Bipolaricaulota bacterium]MDW8126548.1 hypothetical protein [Candidatus Bipolaricaulota bacterium]
MALWARIGRRRWEQIRGLPTYRPPVFLRIAPARESPHWQLSWTSGPDFGADSLPELLDALLRAWRGMPGRPEVQKVVEHRLKPVEKIEPFSPQAVRPPGLLFQKVELDPARWLLILYLARGFGKLLVAQEEKYLGGWWASLYLLRQACQSQGSPPESP